MGWTEANTLGFSANLIHSHYTIDVRTKSDIFYGLNKFPLLNTTGSHRSD
mgnify:CR=1 FL=1